jgi:hypothetical protein
MTAVLDQKLDKVSGSDIKDWDHDDVKNRDDRVQLISSTQTAIAQVVTGLNLEDELETKKSIHALNNTLKFIPTEDMVGLAEDILKMSEDYSQKNVLQLVYSHLVYISTIANPLPSLKQAIKFIVLRGPNKWGLMENKLKMPNLESCADSYFWFALIKVFIDEGYEISHDIDIQDFPWIDNDVAPKGLLNIVNRLRSLQRNPNSVTFRGSKKGKFESIVNDAVDYVILDKLRSKGKIPSSLPVNSVFIKSGMTFINRVNDLNKQIKVPIHYKLRDILSERFKGDDLDHIFDMIVSLLTKIAQRVEPEKVQLPKAMYVNPSRVLKKRLRRGPKSKSKNGKVKDNLYLPFGFYKSKKFKDANPKIIEEASSLHYVSQEANKVCDVLNKAPLMVADKCVGEFGSFIDHLYIASNATRSAYNKGEQVEVLYILKQIKDINDQISSIIKRENNQTDDEMTFEILDVICTRITLKNPIE